MVAWVPRLHADHHQHGGRPSPHPDRHDVLYLACRACEELKDIGFEVFKVSDKSEAVYLRFPGRHGLLRVACHAYRGTPIGMDYVAAWVTFRGGKRDRGTLICSDDRFENMLVIAVGQYMLRSAHAHESEYRGKRGTWENGAGIANQATGP